MSWIHATFGTPLLEHARGLHPRDETEATPEDVVDIILLEAALRETSRSVTERELIHSLRTTLEEFYGAGRESHGDASDTARGDRLAPGDSFGRYRIVGSLGQGGQAQVYLARDSQQAKGLIALKIPRLDQDMGVARVRIRHEAERLRDLHGHPGLPTLYDFGEESGRPYLSLRHVEGASLEEHLRSWRTSNERPIARLSRCVDWGRQAAVVLADLHESKVLHLDIKASNLMIEQETEKVVLIDLGLSRCLRSAPTLTGRLSGTLCSMAPEQVDGDENLVDAGADIYALGLLLYQMLTLEDPLCVWSSNGKLEGHSLPALAPWSDPRMIHVANVIRRACAPHRRDRHIGMRHFLLDLTE